jgi:hypothetical protein
MPVALSPVVETDSHLEDALVQITHRIRLGYPDPFECFVLLEELLLVELLDPGEQGGRGRIIAAAGALRR